MITPSPLPDGFYFDEEKHLYFLDRAPLLGVTSVLRATGIADFTGIPFRYRDYYLARGRAIHACALQYIRQEFDPGYLEKIPEDWANPIIQAIDFIENSGAEILLTEAPVFNDRLNAAGTLDLTMRWQGSFWLPDWKSNRAQKSTAIQTSAYESMLPSLNDPRRRDGLSYQFANEPHHRMAIELPTDGSKWRVRAYTAMENLYDHAIWTNALAVAGWQIRANGRLTPVMGES
jgi:hypothetical protein